jgi:hypothetical protein
MGLGLVIISLTYRLKEAKYGAKLVYVTSYIS